MPISEDTMAEEIPNLTNRHLREIRRDIASLTKMVIQLGSVMTRMDRHVTEGLMRTERAISELRSDMILAENQNLSRFGEKS